MAKVLSDFPLPLTERLTCGVDLEVIARLSRKLPTVSTHYIKIDETAPGDKAADRPQTT